MSITRKDARDLTFVTREQAVDTVIRLMEERDELLEALKAMLVEKPIDELFEYAAWCKKQARAAIAKAEGEQK